MMQLLFEAIVVGITLVIVFQLICFINIKNINIKLFITGVIIHFLFELYGLNKSYCKYGNACKTL